MKTIFVVLALFVCLTQATILQDGQNEVQSETENENGVQLDVWKELREMRDELKRQLQENKQQMEELKIKNTASPKVVFSAGMGHQGLYGPFNTQVIIPFRNVLTNVGNSYSPNTGIFRAPVKGIYHLSASAFGNTNVLVEVYLMKNRQRIFGMSEYPKGANMSISRSVSLLLEQGDEVYLNLRAHCQIYDDGQTYNTFSGFLLFPM